jgi:hypothetical protein
MRKNLLVAALLVSAVGAFAQGTVNFNDRVTSGTGDQGPVVAPIFNANPSNPTVQQKGQPASDWNSAWAGTSGPAPIPAASAGQATVYGGAALRGTGFTVQLWAANVNSPDSALQMVSSTVMSTRTQQSFWGFIHNPTVNPVVPGVIGNTTDRAKFEIRVWDNKGGTIADWASALAAFNQGQTAIGTSGILTIDSPLGVGSTLPPTLQNLRSFSLMQVPEPSVIALGVLGAGCLFMLRRRK